MIAGKSPREKDYPVKDGRSTSPYIGEERAVIKISLSTTSDSPDGQPWPPSEGSALWTIVRRADGYTVWRAIELAQVPSAAKDFGNSAIGSNRKPNGEYDDTRRDLSKQIPEGS